MFRRGIMGALVSIMLVTVVAANAAGASDDTDLAASLRAARISLADTQRSILSLQDHIGDLEYHAGRMPVLFPVFDDELEQLQGELEEAERRRDALKEEIARLEGKPEVQREGQAPAGVTSDERRVFRGEGRFGLQYQEPGLKCQVRDRVLDITLILEADGDASLEFPKWPRAEGLDSKLKGDVLVSKVKCFMEDERRIYTGTWTSNADDTVDAVIDFFLADMEPWPVPITVDAKSPAAAGAEYRVPVFGDCPGKKWSAKKTGRSTLKVGNVRPKADSLRCYLFDFVLIEETG